jgi:hypothetical protein
MVTMRLLRFSKYSLILKMETVRSLIILFVFVHIFSSFIGRDVRLLQMQILCCDAKRTIIADAY